MAAEKRIFHKKLISSISIAMGLMLLLINAIGIAINPSLIDKKQKHVSGSVPGFYYQIQDTTKLHSMLRRPLKIFDLDVVNEAIFNSIIHSDQRRIQIYENWLLWLAGKFYEPLSRTQNSERIVAGEGGICSEVAAVMNSIAIRNGLNARFIGLNGHVISEVQTVNGWRIADPDYGVTYPGSLKLLEGENGPVIIRNVLKAKGYRKDTIDSIIYFFQSSEDNVVFDVGVALSPRLYKFEIFAEWLKWIIPVLLLFIVVIYMKKHIT